MTGRRVSGDAPQEALSWPWSVARGMKDRRHEVGISLGIVLVLAVTVWVGTSSSDSDSAPTVAGQRTVPNSRRTPPESGAPAGRTSARDPLDAVAVERVADGLDRSSAAPSTAPPDHVFYRRLGTTAYEADGRAYTRVLDPDWRVWDSGQGRADSERRDPPGGGSAGLCLVRTADSPVFVARLDELDRAAAWIVSRTSVTRLRIRGPFGREGFECHELVCTPDGAPAVIEGSRVASRGALVPGEPVAARSGLPLAAELRTTALHAGVTYRVAVELGPGCDELLGPRWVSESGEITPPGAFEILLRPARGVEVVLDGLAKGPVRLVVRATARTGGAGLEGSLSAGRAWVSCEALADGVYEVSAFGPDWASEPPNPTFRVMAREPNPTELVLRAGEAADAVVRFQGVDAFAGVPEVWARTARGGWVRLPAERAGGEGPFVRWRGSTLFVFHLNDTLDAAWHLPGTGITGCLELAPFTSQFVEVAPVRPRVFARARDAALAWLAQHPGDGQVFLERSACDSPDGPWITIRYYDLAFGPERRPERWLFAFDDSGTYRLRIHPADGSDPLYVPVLP